MYKAAKIQLVRREKYKSDDGGPSFIFASSPGPRIENRRAESRGVDRSHHLPFLLTMARVPVRLGEPRWAHIIPDPRSHPSSSAYILIICWPHPPQPCARERRIYTRLCVHRGRRTLRKRTHTQPHVRGTERQRLTMQGAHLPPTPTRTRAPR